MAFELAPVAPVMLGVAFAQVALGLMGTLIPLLAGSSRAAIFALGCLMAGTMSPLYGFGAGQTNDRLERGDYVGAAGGLLFIWSVGAAIGLSLAGVAMSGLGPDGLFVYLCAVLAAVAGFVMLRIRARAEVPIGQQSGFLPAGTAPLRLAELASRAIRPRRE